MSELIRSGSVYVSRETRRMLRIVATAQARTVDAVVEGVLHDWLTENHEDVVAFVERSVDMEDALTNRLRQQYEKVSEPEVKGQA